jgi:hypothetical protein
MLFGSAVVVAILLAGSAESRSGLSPRRSQTHLWLETDVRPAPLDLTPKPPVELKSAKACGASGLGVFLPLPSDVLIGAAFQTFRMSQTQRATQWVVALRFRF